MTSQTPDYQKAEPDHRELKNNCRERMPTSFLTELSSSSVKNQKFDLLNRIETFEHKSKTPISGLLALN